VGTFAFDPDVPIGISLDKMSDVLNLEKQLRFYGAYHHDTINIIIHMTCVPLILWTFILLFTNSPSLIPVSSSSPTLLQYLPPNAGLLIALAYCTLYILLEPVAGSILSFLLLASTAYANHLTTKYGSTANYWALGLNICSWIAQFVGHGVFEGRAPALLDNLFQAIFLAPLFVWLELLFFLGYRPELKSRLDEMVEQDVRKFKESNMNGKANGGPITRSQTATNGHAKSG